MFLTSCIESSYTSKNSFSYSAKGFAHIESKLFEKIDGNKFLVSHNKLKIGTKIRISNPANKKFIEATIKKKINMMLFIRYQYQRISLRI